MGADDRSTLAAAWGALTKRLHLSAADGVFAELTRAYAAPARHYHNLRHIAACLEELGTVVDHLADRDSAEMAIFFHDVVYDTRGARNEVDSADAAQRQLERLGAPRRLINTVRELILDTRHSAIPHSPDGRFVVDVDLSILGRPAAEFDAYEAAIRREYAWVPEGNFRSGRAKILRDFLARPSIYQTEHFRAKYEAAARTNLARSIAELEAPGTADL
jgi:predicted metal-dependent HD superfamily phosphohydrolase